MIIIIIIIIKSPKNHHLHHHHQQQQQQNNHYNYNPHAHPHNQFCVILHQTNSNKFKLYQHRPQIAQANLCVINPEKSAAENGVTLCSIYFAMVSRNGTHAAMASSHGTQQWHPAMAPQQWHPAMAPSNGNEQWRPSNGTEQWRPAMAPNVNSLKLVASIRQWHPAMASSSHNGTQQWHPSNGTHCMAPSNGTLAWHPAMALSNGTHQWHPSNGTPAMAPNVTPPKGSQRIE